MGVVLYREGNTHINRGIKCEACVFPVERMKANLNDGWVLDPAEIDNLSQSYDHVWEGSFNDAAEEAPVTDFMGGLDDGMRKEPTLEELREKAKEAGFESWETARTKTLKKVLGL